VTGIGDRHRRPASVTGIGEPGGEPGGVEGRFTGMSIPPVRTLAVVAALAIGAVAAPALADGGDVATAFYTCAAPFGAAHPGLRYVVDPPPGTIVAGQTVRLGTVATFALDAATTQEARAGLGWASLGGAVRTSPTGSRAGLHLAITTTTLANGSTGATNAPASGTTILRATTAGPYAVRLGDLGDLALQGLDDAGRPVSTVEFPASGGFGSCTNDAIATSVTGTGAAPVEITVVRDTTTTSVTAAYSPARERATGTAKVASHFGLAPAGKVEFTLRRGTHVVATTDVRVDGRGVARAAFEHVRRAGSYSVVGTYLGSKALRGSRDRDAFTVGG
jgi:hypothetical protein